MDTWIAQAKELQEDIDRSRAIARQIVKAHDETKLSTVEAEDFKAKAILLREEIDFNNRVAQALHYIKSIDKSLLAAEDELAEGDLLASATELEGVQLRLEESSANNAQRIMQDRLAELREVICGKLDHVLCSRIVFGDDGQTRSLNVVPDTAGKNKNHLSRRQSMLRACRFFNTQYGQMPRGSQTAWRLVSRRKVCVEQHEEGHLPASPCLRTARTCISNFRQGPPTRDHVRCWSERCAQRIRMCENHYRIHG